MDGIKYQDGTAELKKLIDNYFPAWNTNTIAPEWFYAKDADSVYYDAPV